MKNKYLLVTQMDMLRNPKVMDKFYKTGELPDVSILDDPVKAKKLLKKFREKPDPFIERVKNYLESDEEDYHLLAQIVKFIKKNFKNIDASIVICNRNALINLRMPGTSQTIVNNDIQRLLLLSSGIPIVNDEYSMKFIILDEEELINDYKRDKNIVVRTIQHEYGHILTAKQFNDYDFEDYTTKGELARFIMRSLIQSGYDIWNNDNDKNASLTSLHYQLPIEKAANDIMNLEPSQLLDDAFGIRNPKPIPGLNVEKYLNLDMNKYPMITKYRHINIYKDFRNIPKNDLPQLLNEYGDIINIIIGDSEIKDKIADTLVRFYEYLRQWRLVEYTKPLSEEDEELTRLLEKIDIDDDAAFNAILEAGYTDTPSVPLCNENSDYVPDEEVKLIPFEEYQEMELIEEFNASAGIDKDDENKLFEYDDREFVPVYVISMEYTFDLKNNEGRWKKGEEYRHMIVGGVIKSITLGDTYTHALLSFDDTFEHMYSYDKEGIVTDDIMSRDNWISTNSIYISVCFVTKEDRDRMKAKCEELIRHRDKTQYAYSELFKMMAGIPSKVDKRFICSTFVGYIMGLTDQRNIHRSYAAFRPEDATVLPRSFYVMNVKDRNDFVNKRGQIKQRVQKIYNDNIKEIREYNNELPRVMLKDVFQKYNWFDKIFDFLFGMFQ